MAVAVLEFTNLGLCLAEGAGYTTGLEGRHSPTLSP